MRNFAPAGRLGRSRKPLTLVAAGVLVVALGACGNTTSASNSSASSVEPVSADAVDQATLDSTIKRAFLTDVASTDLDPLVVNTLAVASTPLTDDQEDLLADCLAKPECETGRGTLTIGFPNDNTNPFRSVFRAELTAQAIASPQIAKIVYNNAADAAEEIANIRSLIARRVDIIVMNTTYASAILPTVKAAREAGIIVIQAQSPVPDEVSAELDTTIGTDICGLFSEAANKVTGGTATSKSFAMYTGPAGNSYATTWQPCWTDTMTKAGWTESVSGSTDWTPQGAAEAANALLASGQDVGALVYDYTPDDFVKPYIQDGTTPPLLANPTVNYSWIRTLKDAKDAGIDVTAFTSNSQVWYGRLGITAGVMIAAGQDVAAKIDVPALIIDANSVADEPGVSASAPISSLLTPEQIALALSAS